MALSFRLATGETRKYRTSYSGFGESSTYHTKCGMRWIDPPKPEEECEHLDCALAAAKHEIFGSSLFLLLSILIFASDNSKTSKIIFEGGLGVLIAAFGILILAFVVWVFYRSCRDKRELIEFRDKGIIGGVKACQDQSL